MTDIDASVLSRTLRTLPDPLALPGPAPEGARTLTIRPPGSKSLTNRALLLASLAEGHSRLTGALTNAEDAEFMIEALAKLGVGAEVHADGALTVEGVGGRYTTNGQQPTLFLNNAGTATRFLTGACVLSDGPVVIDGNRRMRERPIGELVALLRRLGAEIDELGTAGYVPLRVRPIGDHAGGRLEVATTLSSQYVSALLQIGPWLERGIEIAYTDPATSPSYVRMTAHLLQRLSADVEVEGDEHLTGVRVGHGPLSGFELDVEPDASGATYLWGGAALVEGLTVETPGLGTDSLQGDAAFPELLERMGALVERSAHSTRVTGTGVLRGIDADLSDMPDAAMTLGAVALFAEGPTTLRGLRTLRVKETDRIDAMRTEFAKIGARVDVFEHTGVHGDADEGVVITPDGMGDEAVAFDTYDDHRMAMASALVALRRPNVAINDPACVRKTYPDYWYDFAQLVVAR